MKPILSTTLDSSSLNRLIKDLKSHSIPFNHPYMTHAFKVEDTLIHVYSSKKVVFTGSLAQEVKDRYEPKPSFTPHAGSDEVGTGDYFGPVVVCACTLNPKHLPLLEPYTIMDSKVLDDHDMIRIYHDLKELIPHSLMIVSPTKYNQIHQTHNMNAIKAKLHYEAYLSLAKKTTLPSLCVIDQFTPEASFYRYLNLKPHKDLPLHFETKAESKYLAVALASVFARAVFVLTLQQIQDHYQILLPKGAGSGVDQAARHFIEVHGETALKHVAKLHFKNTSRVLNKEETCQ